MEEDSSKLNINEHLSESEFLRMNEFLPSMGHNKSRQASEQQDFGLLFARSFHGAMIQ
jgi:hypothetical protein